MGRDRRRARARDQREAEREIGAKMPRQKQSKTFDDVMMDIMTSPVMGLPVDMRRRMRRSYSRLTNPKTCMREIEKMLNESKEHRQRLKEIVARKRTVKKP